MVLQNPVRLIEYLHMVVVHGVMRMNKGRYNVKRCWQEFQIRRVHHNLQAVVLCFFQFLIS